MGADLKYFGDLLQVIRNIFLKFDYKLLKLSLNLHVVTVTVEMFFINEDCQDSIMKLHHASVIILFFIEKKHI